MEFSGRIHYRMFYVTKGLLSQSHIRGIWPKMFSGRYKPKPIEKVRFNASPAEINPVDESPQWTG